jgi:general secretion pathway protein A
MYEAFYNLNSKPFQITTDPKFLWLGEKHTEALATLKYGIMEDKGFLLLTGDVGTGKTALINRLVQMIDVAAIVAKVPDPGLTSLDFFNFLAVEFKMDKTFESKGAFLIHLKNFLHQAYSSQKKVLLIIDEAQRLNNELLEQIRLLSNIELQNRKLINIFFVGQTEFKDTLMEGRNLAVRQRIAVTYHIDPLSEAEANQYIRHRLKIAGATREIFGQDAIREISSFSNGYPRLINIICDHALLTGYASDLKSIDKKVIKECERELEIPVAQTIEDGNGQKYFIGKQTQEPADDPEKPSMVKRTGVIAAIIMLLIFGVYFFITQKSSESPRWSMNEIAPQEYQGPSPEKSETGESLDPKVDELKEAPTMKTARADNSPQEIQESSSGALEAVASADAEVNETKKVPATGGATSDETAVARDIQQQATPGKDKQKEESNKTQKLAFNPEQKVLIYFKHNSNELPDEAFETLNRIADVVLRSPDASISIKGYTDSTGSYSYNVSVSQFRANTIKTYLVGKGVDHTKIKATGLGPADPLATNRTLAGRQKNRRIEIEIDID